jgi:hypothetical protein
MVEILSCRRPPDEVGGDIAHQKEVVANDNTKGPT